MATMSACTIDRDIIRRWVEKRGGRPAAIRARSREDYEAAAPRIDFPEYRSTGVVRRISWEEFFRKFERKRLAFVYQEQTPGGGLSRFFRLVYRDATLARELTPLRANEPIDRFGKRVRGKQHEVSASQRNS